MKRLQAPNEGRRDEETQFWTNHKFPSAMPPGIICERSDLSWSELGIVVNIYVDGLGRFPNHYLSTPLTICLAITERLLQPSVLVDSGFSPPFSVL